MRGNLPCPSVRWAKVRVPQMQKVMLAQQAVQSSRSKRARPRRLWLHRLLPNGCPIVAWMHSRQRYEWLHTTSVDGTPPTLGPSVSEGLSLESLSLEPVFSCGCYGNLCFLILCSNSAYFPGFRARCCQILFSRYLKMFL